MRVSGDICYTDPHPMELIAAFADDAMGWEGDLNLFGGFRFLGCIDEVSDGNHEIDQKILEAIRYAGVIFRHVAAEIAVSQTVQDSPRQYRNELAAHAYKQLAAVGVRRIITGTVLATDFRDDRNGIIIGPVLGDLMMRGIIIDLNLTREEESGTYYGDSHPLSGSHALGVPVVLSVGTHASDPRISELWKEVSLQWRLNSKEIDYMAITAAERAFYPSVADARRIVEAIDMHTVFGASSPYWEEFTVPLALLALYEDFGEEPINKIAKQLSGIDSALVDKVYDAMAGEVRLNEFTESELEELENAGIQRYDLFMAISGWDESDGFDFDT